MTKADQTTQQVPNPTGKGGFGDHPENRNPGGWKKEDSISYQYQMLLRLTKDERDEWAEQHQGDMTTAQEIAYERVKAALHSLRDAIEVTDRTEGKAPQSLDVTSGGEKITNPYSELTVEELRKLAGK